MKGSSNVTRPSELQQFVWIAKEVTLQPIGSSFQPKPKLPFAPLHPLRQWFNTYQIHDRETAHSICRLIPAQCPFERTITLFGRPILHIPPLCKLNPLYEEFVGLRFRALCYLADECGEDISQYC